MPTQPSPSSPTMSMSAGQFYAEFPAATQSHYLTGADADAASIGGVCIRLDGRTYAAPMGATVDEDLRNGAEGVDAIVANDGGNAYRISSYEWRPDIWSDGTQLHIYFYTLLCDFTQ